MIQSTGILLNKYLAQAGVCSRRNAVDLIKDGFVKVNNRTVIKPTFLVSENDVVTVRGKKVTIEDKLYILLNKPKGYVTTVSDDLGRQTVMDLVTQYKKLRLFPVGRLDRNTTGLLLLTNDGELAQKLSHPKYEITKGYHATLEKPLSETDRTRFLTGIRLKDGMVKFDRMSHALGPKKNKVRVSLHSGKNRVVRRIFEALGYNVKKLDRVQYATFSKRGLPIGLWRKLSRKEISQLKKVVGMK